MNQHVKPAVDAFGWWRAALQGRRLDYEGRAPQSGYYRKREAAVAFWYDSDDGSLCCAVSQGSEPKEPEQIEELFASCNRYPVPYQVYEQVADGGEWPPHFLIDLTLEEIRAGVVWTEAHAMAKFAERQQRARDKQAVAEAEAGRKKRETQAKDVSAELEMAGAETPKIGHNSGEPHLVARDQLNALLVSWKAWLADIGGKIETEEHSLKSKGFQDQASAIEKDAQAKHKAEKAPVLEASRAIDAKWITGDTSITKQAEQLQAVIRQARTPFEAEQTRKRDEERRRVDAERARIKAEDEKRKAAFAAAAQAAAAKAAEEGRPFGVVEESFLPEPMFDVTPMPAPVPKGKGTKTVRSIVITDFDKVADYLLKEPSFRMQIMPEFERAAFRIIEGGTPIEGASIQTREVAK